MKHKRHTPQQVLGKLRMAEAWISQGKKIEDGQRWTVRISYAGSATNRRALQRRLRRRHGPRRLYALHRPPWRHPPHRPLREHACDSRARGFRL